MYDTVSGDSSRLFVHMTNYVDRLSIAATTALDLIASTVYNKAVSAVNGLCFSCEQWYVQLALSKHHGIGPIKFWVRLLWPASHI